MLLERDTVGNLSGLRIKCDRVRRWQWDLQLHSLQRRLQDIAACGNVSVSTAQAYEYAPIVMDRYISWVRICQVTKVSIDLQEEISTDARDANTEMSFEDVNKIKMWSCLHSRRPNTSDLQAKSENIKWAIRRTNFGHSGANLFTQVTSLGCIHGLKVTTELTTQAARSLFRPTDVSEM